MLDNVEFQEALGFKLKMSKDVISSVLKKKKTVTTNRILQYSEEDFNLRILVLLCKVEASLVGDGCGSGQLASRNLLWNPHF